MPAANHLAQSSHKPKPLLLINAGSCSLNTYTFVTYAQNAAPIQYRFSLFKAIPQCCLHDFTMQLWDRDVRYLPLTLNGPQIDTYVYDRICAFVR